MNIGIAVPHIGPSQLGFLAVQRCNHGLISTPHSYTIFYQEMVPFCMQPSVPVMNVTEMWGFNGTIIATTLDLAEMALNVSGDKIFYPWDLEFLRGNKNFMRNVSIYRNPNLRLIARSNDHGIELSNYCNRDPEVVHDLDIFRMIKNG